MQTLPYFPEIYSDELLYSVVARFKLHMGLGGTKDTNEILFGHSRQHVSYYQPRWIGNLRARMPRNAGPSTSRLVRRHTLFPYYRAGVGLDVAKALYEDMVFNQDPSRPVVKFGRGFGRLEHLRFCPECVSEMLHRHGEMYWMRKHQLPSVLICAIHRCDLYLSEAPVGDHVTVYHAASEGNCKPSAASVVPECTPGQRKILETLAYEVAETLTTGCVGRGGRAERRETLGEGLKRKGLTARYVGLNQALMASTITNQLSYLQSTWPKLFDDASGGGWLYRMCRNSSRAVDPSYRILARQVIESLPDPGDRPFGSGPWVCINAASEHLGLDVVEAVSVRRHGSRYVGHFKCDCGYVYSRTRFQDGRLTPPRLKVGGMRLLESLQKAAQGGRRISECTDLAPIDPKAVGDMTRNEGFATLSEPRRKRHVAWLSRNSDPESATSERRLHREDPDMALPAARSSITSAPLAVLVERYAQAGRQERSKIADEVVLMTGRDRQAVMQALRLESSAAPVGINRFKYGEIQRRAIMAIWYRAGHPSAGRLKMLMPTLYETMEQEGALPHDESTRHALANISVGTIKRIIAVAKRAARRE